MITSNTALRRVRRVAALAACLALLLPALAGSGVAQAQDRRPVIVVSTAPLATLVGDLVGPRAQVQLLIPARLDPHEFSPSARDAERLAQADLIVVNGAGLEAALDGPVAQARHAGVPVFVAADHVGLREGGDEDQAADEAHQHADEHEHEHDPHIWLDPLRMATVMDALAPVLRRQVGVDVSDRAPALAARLATLSTEIEGMLATVPPARRVLVTGHDSMGYFAARYDLRVAGAVVPSLSSQAEASARHVADLVATVRREGAPAVFVEPGTPRGVADAVGRATGARVIALNTHALAADGSYVTTMRGLAQTVADGLRNGSAASGATSASAGGALIAPFRDNDLMRRALLAGVLVAVVSAVVGTFVVLRGLSFIGDALAHGVLPGAAAALLLGAPMLLGAAVGAAVMVGGVTLITRRSRLSGDTAIGLLFAGMLALGVVIISRSDGFSGDLTRILFGDVLGIGAADVRDLAIGGAVVVAAALACRRPFLLLSLDPDAATVMGFRAGRYHALMLALIAVTVVLSFQSVGTLLVFGMIVAPAATAALVTRRVEAMMALAAALGALSVWLGLAASYQWDLAAGGSIVLVQVAVFFAVLGATLVRGHRSAAAVPA